MASFCALRRTYRASRTRSRGYAHFCAAAVSTSIFSDADGAPESQFVILFTIAIWWDNPSSPPRRGGSNRIGRGRNIEERSSSAGTAVVQTGQKGRATAIEQRAHSETRSNARQDATACTTSIWTSPGSDSICDFAVLSGAACHQHETWAGRGGIRVDEGRQASTRGACAPQARCPSALAPLSGRRAAAPHRDAPPAPQRSS